MKKFKKGFTLAEVLITLSIIGIISAIVMPSVISSYQYKAIGVRLSKFAATTEQSTRSYVVQNDSFPVLAGDDNANAGPIVNFINEAFLFTNITDGANDQDTFTAAGISAIATTTADPGAAKNQNIAPGANRFVATLKDGTQVAFATFTNNALPEGGDDADDAVTGLRNAIGDGDKVGMPAFNITFMPNANGLPASVQREYNFVVTELGYIFPSANDPCLWSIYNNQWTTNNNTFRGENNACLTTAAGGQQQQQQDG